MPAVSIIVPSYNCQDTLSLTLSSVRSQQFVDFECIVVDDSSTDASADIARFWSRLDPRFRLICLPLNQGVVVARNAALELASGRYIAFLDSDDLWHPSFLVDSLSVHSLCSPGLVHSSYYRFKVNPRNGSPAFRPIKPPVVVDSSNVLVKNHLPLLSVVVDRELAGSFHFPQIRPEDYALWSLLVLARGLKSVSTEKCLAFYRVSHSQRSSNKLHALPRVYSLYKDFLCLSRGQAFYYSFRWAVNNSAQRCFGRFGLDSVASDVFGEIIERAPLLSL